MNKSMISVIAMSVLWLATTAPARADLASLSVAVRTAGTPMVVHRHVDRDAYHGHDRHHRHDRKRHRRLHRELVLAHERWHRHNDWRHDRFYTRDHWALHVDLGYSHIAFHSAGYRYY